MERKLQVFYGRKAIPKTKPKILDSRFFMIELKLFFLFLNTAKEKNIIQVLKLLFYHLFLGFLSNLTKRVWYILQEIQKKKRQTQDSIAIYSIFLYFVNNQIMCIEKKNVMTQEITGENVNQKVVKLMFVSLETSKEKR